MIGTDLHKGVLLSYIKDIENEITEIYTYTDSNSVEIKCENIQQIIMNLRNYIKEC